jgi:hypothetical protein
VRPKSLVAGIGLGAFIGLDHIKQAQSNVAVFNVPDETPKARIMINSEFSCMGCHQQ